MLLAMCTHADALVCNSQFSGGSTGVSIDYLISPPAPSRLVHDIATAVDRYVKLRVGAQ